MKIRPLVLLIVLSTVQLLFTINVKGQVPIKAENGLLDLTGFDWETDPTVSIEGEWEFYWEKLIEPYGFDFIDRSYAEFPALWNDMQQPGVEPFGYATYRLNLRVGRKHPPLAIKLGEMYTAYELFINGKKAASNGKVGTDKESTTPFWLGKVIDVEPNPVGRVTIVLQIANYAHSKGGYKKDFVLGQRDYLNRRQALEYSFAYFLAGCLLMGGLFFVGLHFFGRHDKAILYFSIFCIAYSYRMVGAQIYPIHLVLDWPWIITTRLEYTVMFISVIFFSEYTKKLYPEDITNWAINILIGFNVIFAGISAFLPAHLFTLLVLPFSSIVPVFILYVTWVYYKAVRNGRPGAKLALLSTAVIFIVILYTILSYFGYFDTNMYINLSGYVVFFFLQSLILSYRFAHSLKMARDRALVASEAKSQFLSTMSHEIRTPLNAVIGLSGLLNQTNLTDEQSEYARTIRLSGENLLSIINNILDYSKIESGKLDLEYNEVNLRTLVEDVLDLLAPLSSKKNLELMYQIDDNTPELIETDSARLQQILVNLIGNAIKFTSEGEVFLYIRGNNTGTKENLLIEVRDTGVGIPREKRKKLFRSFSQIDASTTRKYGGTGLGLAISKKLVNAMGGKIWVESEVDVGTSFYFTITARVLEAAKSIPKNDLLKNKSLFLLDDNETNLKILRHILGEAGLIVTTYSNPREVVQKIDELYRFDVGILDMQMPELDGKHVAEKIRQQWDKKALPLILLSSILKIEDKDADSLFNCKLTKPVRTRLLFDQIESIFTNKSVSIAVPDKSSKDRSTPNIKILLAEDNLINQRVATKLLENIGYNIDIAQNGQEAIHMAKQIPYDLIFMDMNMPVMDGLEATRKLRKLEHVTHEKPIIIAMTANAMKEDKEQCLEAGMDDFISKPVTVDSTRNLIDKWFDTNGDA